MIVIVKGPDVTDSDPGRHEEWTVGKAVINGSKDELREDKFTRCRLCGGMFSEPKILPCLHTFCLRCLEAFNATSQSQSATKQVTCPCCGREFSLPVGGMDQLPVNVFFARLAERRRTLSSVDAVDHSSPEVMRHQ